MSLMRFSSEPEWEDVSPLYVYFSATPDGDGGHNSRLQGLDGATEAQFIEVVMQTLDQSGELDDETLDEVHEALQSRLDYTTDQNGGDD